MRILVVDDDPAICQTLHSRLVHDGHEVFVALNPMRARELMADHFFEMAIIDLELHHVLTGVDVARHLPQKTAKVLFTGYNPKDVIPQLEDPMRVFWCVVQKGGDLKKVLDPIVAQVAKMQEDTQP